MKLSVPTQQHPVCPTTRAVLNTEKSNPVKIHGSQKFQRKLTGWAELITTGPKVSILWYSAVTSQNCHPANYPQCRIHHDWNVYYQRANLQIQHRLLLMQIYSSLFFMTMSLAHISASCKMPISVMILKTPPRRKPHAVLHVALLTNGNHLSWISWNSTLRVVSQVSTELAIYEYCILILQLWLL